MLLHISFGLITALVAHHMFGVEMSWWLCLVCVLAALLPDIDALPELWTKGRVAAHSGNMRDHRDGLHYPLLTTPSVFVITAVVAYSWSGSWQQTWFWATLVSANVLIHFILDSFGVGWGIKWLHVPHVPESNKNYKFFCNRQNEPALQLMVSWDPKALKQAIFMHGDKDWLRKYLSSTFFLCEWVIFILTCSAVLAAFSNTTLY